MDLVVSAPDLRSVGLGADYLVIGPTDLLKPFQPLLDWRAQEELRGMAVPVEAVYDPFNDGFPKPVAIQALVRYAVQHWYPSPQYIVLVGDASYDPKSYISSAEANRLPAFLVNTRFGGETASDVNFVQVNEDPYPDPAIGLIPARTPAQVRVLVDKSITYERSLSFNQFEPQKILAITNGQEAQFQRDGREFLSRFPESIFQGDLLAASRGDANARKSVMERWHEDYRLIA